MSCATYCCDYYTCRSLASPCWQLWPFVMYTHVIKCTRDPILGHFVQSTFFHPARYQAAVGVHLRSSLFWVFYPTLDSSFGTAYRPFSYCIPTCSWAISVVSSHRGFWLDVGMCCTCLQILTYTVLYNILVTWMYAHSVLVYVFHPEVL